jgi:hypothetical protein
MKVIYTTTGAIEIEKKKDTYSLFVSYKSWGKRLKAVLSILTSGKTPEEILDYPQARKASNALIFRTTKRHYPSSKTHE